MGEYVSTVNMAAELVEGGGQNDDVLQQPEVESDMDDVASKTENMDITIVANTSELADISLGNNAEEIYKLGFSLNDLYKLSLQFYKKGKDELNLSYSNKVQLVALWKQVSSGRYSKSKFPEIGYFDVIGNDRRKAWEALQDMAPDVAKQQFCELLETNCPAYVNFVNEKKEKLKLSY